MHNSKRSIDAKIISTPCSRLNNQQHLLFHICNFASNEQTKEQQQLEKKHMHQTLGRAPMGY